MNPKASITKFNSHIKCLLSCLLWGAEIVANGENHSMDLTQRPSLTRKRARWNYRRQRTETGADLNGAGHSIQLNKH